jgi:uncharacterized protein YukE
LVAQAGHEPPSSWAGVWIAEDVESIARGVADHSWIEGTLGLVGAGLDGLAIVSDPVGALLQYGIAWLIEHVKPLSEALDWLAGDPAAIAAQAQTWRNIAESLRADADDVARQVSWDLTDWQGAAANAYRSWADQRDKTLQTLARASDVMVLITEGAGVLIGTVRMMVRDAVATVVSRLIVYAGELAATVGLATPLVVEQVTTLCASWAARISRWLKDLIASLRNLMREAARLGDAIKGAAKSRPRPPALHSRSGALSNREVLDQGVGLPRTTETVQRYAELGEVDLRGTNVEIVESADDIAYLDYQGAVARTDDLGVQLGPAAFQDEETLVRTLGHESVHVRQYEAGRVTSMTGPLEDEAYAAEDAYVQNWRRNRP